MKTQKRIATVGILAVIAITLVAFAVLSLTGCENPTNSPSPNPGNPTTRTAVYIAGEYGDSYTACYWRNGVRTDLPVPVGLVFSYASRIAVSSNGDVHIIGQLLDKDFNSTSCYWKNGVRTDLSVPSGTTYWFDDIAVSANGDVHIIGWLDGQSCYWKNGVRTNLSFPAGIINNFLINDIAVSANGDVYILVYYTGHDVTDNNEIGGVCYWKNGVRTDLDLIDPSGFIPDISGIAVSANGDVYITGYYYSWDDFANEIVHACYWKNGVRTDLSVPAGTTYTHTNAAAAGGGGAGWVPAGTTYTHTNDIAVSANGDVHIIGSYGTYHYDDYYSQVFDTTTYCYWKNGVRTNLSVPAGTKFSSFDGIAVSANGDAYITGNYGEANNIDYLTACYWKNGVRTDLSANSMAGGILVVTQ